MNRSQGVVAAFLTNLSGSGGLLALMLVSQTNESPVSDGATLNGARRAPRTGRGRIVPGHTSECGRRQRDPYSARPARRHRNPFRHTGGARLRSGRLRAGPLAHALRHRPAADRRPDTHAAPAAVAIAARWEEKVAKAYTQDAKLFLLTSRRSTVRMSPSRTKTIDKIRIVFTPPL